MNKATIYGLIAVLLWSTVATAFKFALREHTPAQVLFWSVLVSVTALWLIVIGLGSLNRVVPTLRQNWRMLLLVALINPTLYYLVLFEAYDLLPAQLAQPINYTWAIMLAILSVPFLGQTLSKYDYVGGLLGYLGVVVIASQGSLPWHSEFSGVGIFLALFSTVLWAVYWLLNTKLRGDALLMMTLSFTIAVPFIAVWVSFTDGFVIHWSNAKSLIWIGLFEMGVTFALWQQALRLTDRVAKIGNLIFLSPFISLLLISYFLGEDIHISTLLGLVLIIFGVFYQQKKTA